LSASLSVLVERLAHLRRCTSAIRAFPPSVLGPVDSPPWKQHRRLPSSTRPTRLASTIRGLGRSIAAAVGPWTKLFGIGGPARFRRVAKRGLGVRTRKLARAPPRFPPCLFHGFHHRAFPPARLLLLGVERACPVGILGRRWNLDAERFGTLAFSPRGGLPPWRRSRHSRP
jgi:hypothetical protein